jgi:hypothetical protein
MRAVYLFVSSAMLLSFGISTKAQISPGDLAQAHSNLEGISNCTSCHVLGEKVSNEKCLTCHSELKNRIDQKKGYHSSLDVAGKNCITCHSDHHGRNFELIRFTKETFNHKLTGFALLGAHLKKACSDCHKIEFIDNPKIKSKKFTYLGLHGECLNCHEDYHRNSLPSDCSNCHGPDSFKPASKFSHNNARFQLTGKHQIIECTKCHKITSKEGKKFQEFTGLQYMNCTDCHNDPHKNQFGQNCKECHTTESFHLVKGTKNFDHNKTDFPLLDKHALVTCKSCHKNKFTDPISHSKCMDCHQDYHEGQFTKQGIKKDCSGCHTTKGFSIFSFSIEEHNAGTFHLDGAHLATACYSCHKKQEKWSFRNIGNLCNDCHKDIHELILDKKFYPGSNCLNCHNKESWHEVSFDHSSTSYPLTGSHAQVDCRFCHFRKGEDGKTTQQFAKLNRNCASCHSDVHRSQFETDGTTDCLRCHSSGNWKLDKFDHNKTLFKLEGQHEKVACSGCHKKKNEGQFTYVFYKIKETKCEDCH